MSGLRTRVTGQTSPRAEGERVCPVKEVWATYSGPQAATRNDRPGLALVLWPRSRRFSGIKHPLSSITPRSIEQIVATQIHPRTAVIAAAVPSATDIWTAAEGMIICRAIVSFIATTPPHRAKPPARRHSPSESRRPGSPLGSTNQPKLAPCKGLPQPR